MSRNNIRNRVHAKFGGHCAYCGRKITIKSMQVEHMEPKRNIRMIGREIDGTPIYNTEQINHINNLMPSCRFCNNYKGGNTLEGFRTMIKNMAGNKHLIFASTAKGEMLESMGIVSINEWDGMFYFEKYNKEKETP